MSDANLVSCNEQHEMITVLKRFGKRQTNDNLALIKKVCSKFKENKKVVHNRKNFYQYIENGDLLKRME